MALPNGSHIIVAIITRNANRMIYHIVCGIASNHASWAYLMAVLLGHASWLQFSACILGPTDHLINCASAMYEPV